MPADRDKEKAMKKITTRVLKYQLPFGQNQGDEVVVDMPDGALVLTIQVQHGKPVIWALVDRDSENKMVERRFRIADTGHPIEIDDGADLHYIATFQLGGGELVFHVFERVSL